MSAEAELKGQKISFKCESYEGSMFHRVRSVSFAGAGYDVYNFIAIPHPEVDMPIFGADIVVMGGRLLVAVDFQPITDGESYFPHSGFYNDLRAVHTKYQTLGIFPDGGELPEEAQRFFSPCALWSKVQLPPEERGGAEEDDGGGSGFDSSLVAAAQAVTLDYARSYARTVIQAHRQKYSSETSTVERATFLEEYLNYRTRKDPAKALLKAAFGEAWVTRALQRAIFPPIVTSPQRKNSQKQQQQQQQQQQHVSITFLTENENKRSEMEELFVNAFGQGRAPHLTARALNLPEMQGDPMEVAIAKCRLAREAMLAEEEEEELAAGVRRWVMTEDTSLCFEALNELPGPYIKWFLKGLGHKGLNKLLAGYEDKSAFAQCIITICPLDRRDGGAAEDADPISFIGRCYGDIVPPRSNSDAFGWDPIFEPRDGGGLTFGEMSIADKNEISHRSIAFQKLCHYLKHD